jgi:tetratricopeptide (TPR) repeat protein
MPLDIKGYRVFIASPGGLDEERRAFRDTLAEYNASEAFYDDVQFFPVGWEDTLAGVGRPQALINEDVRKCDFFVLLLWDRWGSDPGGGSVYTSGTEEEFNIALECRREDSQPMRQIVVLFKAVDPRQLSDPGEQLSKVLEFKRTLEIEKQHLYQTFDTLDSFKVLLRRHLGAWLRLRDKGLPPTLAELPNDHPSTDVPDGSGVDVNELVREAIRLAVEGKRTDAEALFAKATVGRSDPDALIEYGQFLYRDGRLSQALTVFESALSACRTSGPSASEAKVLRSIGRVLFTRGELEDAKSRFLAALKLDESLGTLEGQADDYRSIGRVLQLRGDLDGAQEMYLKGLEIDEHLGRAEGQADDHRRLGNVLFTRGDLDGAEQRYHQALEINQRLLRFEGQAEVFGNIGNVLLMREDLDGAEQMYRKALEIDERLGRLEGLATHFGNIGIVLDMRGEYDDAEQMYRKAVEIDEHLGKLDGLATHYVNLGVVFYKRGNLGGAEEMWRKAISISERLGAFETHASAYYNLGRVFSARRDFHSAEQMYRKALELEGQLGNPHRIQSYRAALNRAVQAAASAVSPKPSSTASHRSRKKPTK